jgi:hypothetical protein
VVLDFWIKAITLEKKVAKQDKMPRKTYLGSSDHEDSVPLLPLRELARLLHGGTCEHSVPPPPGGALEEFLG